MKITSKTIFLSVALCISMLYFYQKDSEVYGLEQQPVNRLELENAQLNVFSPTAKGSLILYTPRLDYTTSNALHSNYASSYFINHESSEQQLFFQAKDIEYSNKKLIFKDKVNIFNLSSIKQFNYINIEKVILNTQDNTLNSNSKVKIYSDDFTIEGNGLFYDLNKLEFKLLNNVKTIIY